MSNTINTRIKLKYDSLTNWIASSQGANPFIPLRGEVCVAEIPSAASNSGLTPPAIGVKVGNGVDHFVNLPWIQAIAGDVYGWTKEAPTAGDIKISYYGNSNTRLQDAINGITSSLGNIVSQGVDPSSLGQALADLQAQLSSGSGTIFDSEPLSSGEPIQIIRSLEQDGLSIVATQSALTEDDLPDISINKISDLVFHSTYNSVTNQAATMNDIYTALSPLGTALHFLGIATNSGENIIEDGSNTLPIIDGNTIPASSLQPGDIILLDTGSGVIRQEYIWTGTHWELLGDEGSYAIKGSIAYSDLSSSLQGTIDGKLDATTAAITYVEQVIGSRLMTDSEGTKLAGITSGAEPNIIESISVNGTTTTITNKNVDLTIPIIKKATGNSTETISPDANHSITFNPIAFDGDVKHLTQTDTILIFDCGTSSAII